MTPCAAVVEAVVHLNASYLKAGEEERKLLLGGRDVALGTGVKERDGGSRDVPTM